jgi:hypothetical protein
MAVLSDRSVGQVKQEQALQCCNGFTLDCTLPLQDIRGSGGVHSLHHHLLMVEADRVCEMFDFNSELAQLFSLIF